MGKSSHYHDGHRQRLRDRYAANGLNAFADHEVLELVLGYAIPRQDVNPLAHQLIKRYGSLHGVFEADRVDLQHVDGIGEYSALLLTLFSAVGARCEASRQAGKEVLTTRQDAEQHCIRLLKGCKEEHCYAVCLNGQLEVLADVLVARGSLCEVPSYPRVIADYALRYNAHSIILCHNHPGGSITPSAADIGATRLLRDTLAALEVRLIDHFIVAGQQAASMMDDEMLNHIGSAVVANNRAANSAGEVALKRQIEKLRKQLTEET